MATKIEWVKNPDGGNGESWNPISGCRGVSLGCLNCYAARLAATRLSNSERYLGLATLDEDGRGQWTGKRRIHSNAVLEQPLRWRKARTIFVCSMSDLFYAPAAFIAKMFNVMLSPKCEHHKFIILTKRASRMRWMLDIGLRAFVDSEHRPQDLYPHLTHWLQSEYLLPNNIIGMITAENSMAASIRIRELLASPFQTRGVSLEPLLGPIRIAPYLYEVCCRSANPPDPGCNGPGCMGTKLDWVIVGRENGPHARLMDENWARSLRDHCLEAEEVSFFYKGGKLDGIWYHGFPFHVAEYSG